jgi:hypothetical protein
MPVDQATWAGLLAHHLDGRDAPPHLLTKYAHTQGMDIAGVLVSISEMDPSLVVRGLCHRISRAIHQGRVIRSLGFVAERLVRMAQAGDYSWALADPYCVDDLGDAMPDEPPCGVTSAGLTSPSRG